MDLSPIGEPVRRTAKGWWRIRDDGAHLKAFASRRGPKMKMLLQTAKPILQDLASTLLFVLLYALTRDLAISIGAAVAIGVGQIAWAKLGGRRIYPMQWMSLALVVVLGGATMLTHDPRFVMVKPTVIYAAIGVVMLQRGWQIRYLPARAAAHVEPATVIAWGYVWAALMFAIAAGNLVLALTVPVAVWAWCVAVLFNALKVGLFAVQYTAIRLRARRRLQAQPVAA